MFQSFAESAKESLADLATVLSKIWIEEKATVVIPAFNEEKTVAKVVQTALESGFVDEAIVVDDGSSDATAEKAKGIYRVNVVSHERNLGKGRAIKTGIENASNDVILFLDADLLNITVEKIDKLLLPLLRRKADFVKASFSRSRGRVTEFAVKPMMKILLPEQRFSQPISGQFASRKSFLSELKIADKWGIDIALLLDALKQNKRIVEIDIGELQHKARTTEEVAETSKQVLLTMLRKAGVFADRFSTIVFSENALFAADKPRKNAGKVVRRLQKRKFKVLLLGYGGKEEAAEKANYLSLDGFIAISANKQGQLALASFKKALKRNGSRIEETAFVASRQSEAFLLKAAGFGICFAKSKKLKKNARMTINALPEILLLEEE